MKCRGTISNELAYIYITISIYAFSSETRTPRRPRPTSLTLWSESLQISGQQTHMHNTQTLHGTGTFKVQCHCGLGVNVVTSSSPKQLAGTTIHLRYCPQQRNRNRCRRPRNRSSHLIQLGLRSNSKYCLAEQRGGSKISNAKKAGGSHYFCPIDRHRPFCPATPA